MSNPFFGPQGRNINKLDSLSFNTLNTGFAYIESTGTVTTKKISTNEIANSVNLPGVPTTATASKGTNTTQIATTKYVQEAIADYIPPSAGATGETTTDATKVSLTGNETISGIKTFSDSILTPTATISGNTFMNNTVYINGGFYWRIKNITSADHSNIITLRNLGFPYYQIYILDCLSSRILLDIPSEDNKGVRILFRKKRNQNFWFYTSTGSYIVAANSVNLTNEIVVGNISGVYTWEFICDGTRWYQFNIS